MDRALSGATTPGQSGPGSITGTSPSDCLVSYPGDSLEVQSVYSTAPTNWAMDN